MGRASTRLHEGDRLAAARDKFLASEPVDHRVVREPILASWWRSREWNIAPDHLDLNYLRPPDLESSLARAAEPVLRHLHTQLDGQPISIVLALGNDVVMLNDHARTALSPGDQAALISQATEALGRRRSAGAVTVDLPSGAVARMFLHSVADDFSGRDGVVHVKLGASSSAALEVPTSRVPMSLPGLVGSGAAWRRACRDAEGCYERGEWMTLEGESGVGKLALVRAVHQRRSPAAGFHVLDAAAATGDWAAQVRGELLDDTGMLVIRHVDTLSGRQVRALSGALQEAKAAGKEETLRVAVTLDRSQARADLTALLRLFPGTVQVPPLRHHNEDLRELVPFFLGKLSQQGRVTCSAAAMQLLLRHTWPGNAAQLWQVLKQVVQRRRAGAIGPADLPPECWTVSRRVLSPLESIERDAIVQSLLDNGGNKIRAARALGMSRATIYRRIHEYGIVTPPVA